MSSPYPLFNVLYFSGETRFPTRIRSAISLFYFIASVGTEIILRFQDDFLRVVLKISVIITQSTSKVNTDVINILRTRIHIFRFLIYDRFHPTPGELDGGPNRQKESVRKKAAHGRFSYFRPRRGKSTGVRQRRQG